MHALDGRSGVLGHFDPGAGGAGEGHHVHARMAGDRCADRGAVAVDHVVDARRHAGRVHDLGPDIARERRDFRRLQHHGAAGGDSRRHLRCDLVHRPVPRRDEAADADGLLSDQSRAAQVFELVGLQDLDRRLQVADAHRRLGPLGQPARRAHFFGDRRRHVGVALLVLLDDALQELDALGAAGAGEALERGACGFHRKIDVRSRAQADPSSDALGRRIDHVQGLRRDRIDPGAVDVEFQIIAHDVLPLTLSRAQVPNTRAS